jgi:hypothetical protein
MENDDARFAKLRVENEEMRRVGVEFGVVEGQAKSLPSP